MLLSQFSDTNSVFQPKGVCSRTHKHVCNRRCPNTTDYISRSPKTTERVTMGINYCLFTLLHDYGTKETQQCCTIPLLHDRAPMSRCQGTLTCNNMNLKLQEMYTKINHKLSSGSAQEDQPSISTRCSSTLPATPDADHLRRDLIYKFGLNRASFEVKLWTKFWK
jgi:hypothetical protein